MRTVGIIAEYNPFHKGHSYQIESIRRKYQADYIVIAMSGDYVQRGTPALFPKHVRAEMALKAGADLVFELPVSVSTASAEFFAQGGISLFHKLNIIDQVCFGSECGNIQHLKDLAIIFLKEPFEYQQYLKEYLSMGLSFPAARNQAVCQYLNTFSSDSLSSDEARQILSTPNNILGIEYCKAILRMNSQIQPVTLLRKGNGYHEESLTSHAFPSATGIRAFIHSHQIPPSDLIKDQLPLEVLSIFHKTLEANCYLHENDLSQILHYKLLYENELTLTEYLDISKDLAKRIVNKRNEFQSFSQFSQLLKTKEMTQTRIQRALLHILLNIKDSKCEISYARVLGFRKNSSALLKVLKERSEIPLISKMATINKITDHEILSSISETTTASNLYESILSQKTGNPFVHEYQKPVIVV